MATPETSNFLAHAESDSVGRRVEKVVLNT